MYEVLGQGREGKLKELIGKQIKAVPNRQGAGQRQIGREASVPVSGVVSDATHFLLLWLKAILYILLYFLKSLTHSVDF